MYSEHFPTCMMAPTHVAAGPVIAIPLLVLSPEFAVVGALAAIVGGIFPDLDLFSGRHRKTLHYPVLYWVAALPILGVAMIVPTAVTIGLAFFLVAAAVHSGLDWFGAGDEIRPWEATSSEGVYVHVSGRWLEPKRWVRYDGAPEDLGLAAALSMPGIVWFGDPVRELLVVALAIGIVYALIRRRVPHYVGPYLE